METQLKPTKAIIETCELIDEGISQFFRNLRGVLGKYESHSEAYLMMIITIRYLESIVELAKCDLVLLPAAKVLARSVFETSINIVWLINPRDTFECEARWLGRLKSEEDFYKKLIEFKETIGVDDSDLHILYEMVFQFRTKIEHLMKEKGYKRIGVPNFREMLKSIGIEKLYFDYIVLSQFTHSTPYALGLYKRGYGTKKESGEYIEPNNWKPVLEISWNAFEVAGVFKKVCHWLRNDSMLVDMFSEPVAEFPCQSAMDFGPVENTAFPRFGIADQI